MGVQIQYTKVERLQLGPVQEIAEDEDKGTGCFYVRELTVTHKEGQHSVNLFADTPGALTLPGEPRPDEWKPKTQAASFTRCPSCGKTHPHPPKTSLYHCVCGFDFLQPHAGDRVTYVNDSGEGVVEFVYFVYPDGKHVRLVGDVDPVPVIALARMP